MTRHRTVALAVVLALAGCSGAGLWGPSTPTPTPVTPMPVPDETGSLAGVAGDRVNEHAVGRAHAEALAGTNYTVRVRQRVVGPAGEQLREMRKYREVSRGADRYWGYVRLDVRAEVLREFGTTNYWSNETHVATRFDSPLRQAQTRLWESDSGGPIRTPSNSRHLRAFLRASDPSVAERSDDGTVVLTGTASTPHGQFEMPPALTDPSNVSARFRVRGDGTVVGWRVAYDAGFGDGRVRVVRAGEVTAIGETAVVRPAWVDEAATFDTDSSGQSSSAET